MIYSIIVDEGFELHHRKTRAQGQAASQHIVGLAVNHKPNIARREFDALKAMLRDRRRYGPKGQNHPCHQRFHQHLLGRIARVAQLSPHRGQKLLREFRHIDWPPAKLPTPG